MGAVTVDLWRLERQYDLKYPMDNPFGIRAILEDYHSLWERTVTEGDYDALIVVLDFIGALEEARLTPKQKRALYYVYMEKMTQEEAASELGCAQNTVNDRVYRAILKIAESQGYSEEWWRETYRCKQAV
ncbi:sigma factor-like helix-turn-helix DNA-binding protein [Paenibacillus sp. FSL H7-0940]|uniref:RNA polymerase sigma factor n=1 Tax=Paenibacillus sp. FSL H7-0940 TaxID=2921443 RepID=UPI0030EF3E84